MDATGVEEGVIGPATKLGVSGRSVAMNGKLEAYARPNGCMRSSKLTYPWKTLTANVLAMLATGGSDVALAQTYPACPVRFVAPFTADGGGAIVVRSSGDAPGPPRLSESGLPGFDAVTWIGMVARAGQPRTILQWRDAEAAVILGDTEVQERIESLGVDRKPSTPDPFAAYIRSEITQGSKVVREAGITTQ